MKLLDKITKWFFNTTKIEVNTDWRLVALDTNRELIDLQEKYQQANQRISDLEKRLAIYKEKENTK
nr:MAG TPA: FapF periplasmic coiled coil, PROTEIN [Caudoviricetes sp.]